MVKQKLKILVVDDEEFLRAVLVDLLQELGYEVLQASDGIEALGIYRDKKDEIDIVVLDLTMPSMDGIEVLREIKKMNEDARVILTSGYLPDKRVEELIQSKKGIEYIQKPYDLEEIERAIESFFEQG